MARPRHRQPWAKPRYGRFNLTHGRTPPARKAAYTTGPPRNRKAYVPGPGTNTAQAPGCLPPRPPKATIDHITAWQHHGPTIETNLCVVCRRHHRAKHNGFRLYPHRHRPHLDQPPRPHLPRHLRQRTQPNPTTTSSKNLINDGEETETASLIPVHQHCRYQDSPPKHCPQETAPSRAAELGMARPPLGSVGSFGASGGADGEPGFGHCGRRGGSVRSRTGCWCWSASRNTDNRRDRRDDGSQGSRVAHPRRRGKFSGHPWRQRSWFGPARFTLYADTRQRTPAGLERRRAGRAGRTGGRRPGRGAAAAGWRGSKRAGSRTRMLGRKASTSGPAAR